ncbi:MAG: hypothetical protein [Microvirus sp.]|nr:MAG: hypothetical protein [Microvirus sp.]
MLLKTLRTIHHLHKKIDRNNTYQNLTREQSSQMRRQNIHRLILVDSLSQNLVRRQREIPAPQPNVKTLKKSRLPILGLRSQRERTVTRQNRNELYPGRTALFSQLKENPASPSICHSRKIRREILFRTGIAGRNRHRSPGRNGTYRRTADSLTSSCKH